MSLRSFAGYGNTAPYFPFVQGVSGVGAGKMALSLVNLDGTTAAAGFLQLFDRTSGNPTNGTVPLKSFDVTAAGPLPSLFSELAPITFVNGICIAMSSTQTTYTAVATAFDAFGEVEEWEGASPILIPNVNTAGDLVTGVNLLQVWADGAGPKKLYQIDYINNNASPVYVAIFAAQLGASPAETPIYPLGFKVTGTTPVSFRFGRDGISPFLPDGNGVLRNGCFIQPLTTPVAVVGNLVSSGDQNILAYYK